MTFSRVALIRLDQRFNVYFTKIPLSHPHHRIPPSRDCGSVMTSFKCKTSLKTSAVIRAKTLLFCFIHFCYTVKIKFFLSINPMYVFRSLKCSTLFFLRVKVTNFLVRRLKDSRPKSVLIVGFIDVCVTFISRAIIFCFGSQFLQILAL